MNSITKGVKSQGLSEQTLTRMKMKTSTIIALSSLFSVSVLANTPATLDMHTLSAQASTQYPDITPTTVDKIASRASQASYKCGFRY